MNERNQHCKIYLIRHGQTDWNLAKRIQGSQDIPLNETGKRQAALLAEGMRTRPVARFFSSPMKRARETARAVADSQNVPLYLVDGLEEIHYGEWEGMTMEEIRTRFPEEYTAWWKDPVNGAPPGGESQMEVLLRSARAMEAIKADAAKDRAGAVAVVSHGAAICCILPWLLKEQALKEDGYSIINAAVTTIDYNMETGICVLESLNDARHLEHFEEKERPGGTDVN
ncbi:MAG: histidine phosphatase family protein [Lachnospiraceae bacterium]|nr:histidine phosphatase family protein [Lachnospiraceae bacterium]